MPRQSFGSSSIHSSSRDSQSSVEQASDTPAYSSDPPPPPPFTTRTEHLSPDDQLYLERYHTFRDTLNGIIEIAIVRHPSRISRYLPNFDTQVPVEVDRKKLENWRDDLLDALTKSDHSGWNFLDGGNYEKIGTMLEKLQRVAASKKLIKSKLKYDHVPGARQPREYRLIPSNCSVSKLVADLHLTPRPHPPSYASPRQSARPNRSEHSLAQHRRIGYRQASMRKLRTVGQARDGGLLL
ncbi:hypothetical protein JCM5353_008219 [Sporobolomyces roseus]